MNQEQYWRNLIADEIKAEHDRVMRYYRKRGMNAGGMTNEEHTRLNIFLLCESIARTIHNTPDAPKLFTPAETVKEVFSPSTVEPVVADPAVQDNQITIHEAINDIEEDSIIEQDPVRNLVKDTPQQDEFGQFL